MDNGSTKQKCTACLEEFSLSEFYIIRAKNEIAARHEKICKACKREKARLYKQKLGPSPAQSHGKVVALDQSFEYGSGSSNVVLKEYQLPDGRILKLDRDEFLEIVDAFRTLINGKRRREGKAVLLG